MCLQSFTEPFAAVVAATCTDTVQMSVCLKIGEAGGFLAGATQLCCQLF